MQLQSQVKAEGVQSAGNELTDVHEWAHLAL